jgi:hypothetical protein
LAPGTPEGDQMEAESEEEIPSPAAAAAEFLIKVLRFVMGFWVMIGSKFQACGSACLSPVNYNNSFRRATRDFMASFCAQCSEYLLLLTVCTNQTT